MMDFIMFITTKNILFLLGTISALYILNLVFSVISTKFRYERFLKKSRRFRKKKYNGELLIKKLKRKRKRNTNNYKKLKGPGKKLAKKYFIYKITEIPDLVKFAYGKIFPRRRPKIRFEYIQNNRSVSKSTPKKKELKKFIKQVNKYDCLDEFILFLHKLPDAITNDEELEIKVKSNPELRITYKIY